MATATLCSSAARRRGWAQNGWVREFAVIEYHKRHLRPFLCQRQLYRQPTRKGNRPLNRNNCVPDWTMMAALTLTAISAEGASPFNRKDTKHNNCCHQFTGAGNTHTRTVNGWRIKQAALRCALETALEKEPPDLIYGQKSKKHLQSSVYLEGSCEFRV